MRSPSSRARLPRAPSIQPSLSVSGRSGARSELITKYYAATGSNGDEGTFPDGTSIMTSKDLARSLGIQGLDTTYRTGSMVWQYGRAEELFARPKPAEVLAFGAKLCAGRESTLEPLEALIEGRTKMIRLNLQARFHHGKTDENFYVEYDQARFQYRTAIMDIILGAVNAGRQEVNASARGLVLKKTLPFDLDDKIILPADNLIIFDQDSNRPAMSIYFPSELAATTRRTVKGQALDSTAFQIELALHMKLHGMLQFQGVTFDGTLAQIVSNSVQSQSHILAKHKTDVFQASYTFPMNRDLFVADMFRLLQDYTDFRKVYGVHVKTNRWNPRKGPYGAVVPV